MENANKNDGRGSAEDIKKTIEGIRALKTGSFEEVMNFLKENGITDGRNQRFWMSRRSALRGEQ